MKRHDPVITTENKSDAAATVAMLPGIPVMFWAMTSGHLLLGMVVAAASLAAGRLARRWVASVHHD